jgi:hypothetical protein
VKRLARSSCAIRHIPRKGTKPWRNVSIFKTTGWVSER